MLFISQAKTSIDEKGRTSFPREFRRQLPDNNVRNLVVSIGPGRTLHVYMKEDFAKYAARLERLPNTPQNTIFKQRILGRASEVELDGQNRIMITKEQLYHAQLTDEVIFVGEGRKIVMWNPESYERIMGFADEDAFAAFDKAYYDVDSDGVGDDG